MPTLIKHFCKVCNRPFDSKRVKAVYCGDDCRNKALKRPERPTCKKLMDVMADHEDEEGEVNWTAVGREFGTTSKTAHIWAEQYGLIAVKFYIGKVFY